MKENLYGIAKATQSDALQSNYSRWLLRNLEDTISLGTAIVKKFPNLDLVLLEGELGAGKTSLVKGIASELGILEPITSPTFALAQHYPTGKRPLIHLDLYRLEQKHSADELFLEEEEQSKEIGAIMVVEWPERLGLKITDAILIKLIHQKNCSRLAEVITPQRLSRKAFTS